MHRHSHPDLLGSEGPDFPHDTFDDQESSSAYWYNQEDMSFIDPSLRSFSSYESTPNVQYQKSFDNRYSYDPNAHGFSPQSLRMNTDSVLPQLGVFDPGYQDIDHFRHLRHFSPADPLGFTLSSNTDSSVSDYALSPEVVRSSQSLHFPYSTQGIYGTSIGMPSATSHVWSPPTSLIATQPHTPAPAQHTVQSMRHLQLTPDPEHEEESLDDKDVLQARINFPEELEISEHVISPPDSGLDRSLDDDETMKDDDEDSAAAESDSDSEFRLKTHSSHRPSNTGIRHSLRQAQHPKSVIDPKARITKPSHAREASHSGTPRAKSKRKPPVTKKDDSTSKNFPCAFHHYGCCATFANKNEWKRHVSSQHLQLGFYRCDKGSCSDQHKGHNDFNRKDLFTQHCRRMHAPWSGTKKGEDGVSKKEKDNFEKQLEATRTRCWIDRREAPQKTKCGFCGKKFIDGRESRGWDERMEHVGRHFERDNKKSEDEAVDSGLRDWAITEGVVKEGKRKGEYWLVGFEPVQSGRVARGSRRSIRFAKEESSEQEEEIKNETDVDDDSEEESDSNEVKHAIVPMKTEESEDAESDTDAEAEDE